MPPIKHDSNTDIFRGQLFIFVGNNPIAYGKDATMNVTTEEIDISNKMMSGGWKGSLPGKKSFSITSESLMTHATGQESFDSLLNKQINDETFPFVIGEAKVTEQTPTGGKFELDRTKPYYSGTVMITSLDVKSTDGDIATCSASFTGIGALVPGTPTT
jgi:predicted secreted protein